MSFKISYNQEDVNESSNIIPEGKYEASIISAEYKEWNDNHFIGFGVEIRSDLDRKYGGYKILYNNIQISPTLEEFEDKRIKKVAAFMSATKQVAGKDLDVNELCSDIVGKNVLVYVIHKRDNKDKLWPKVSFVAKSNAKDNPNSNKKQVDEDQLPF